MAKGGADLRVFVALLAFVGVSTFYITHRAKHATVEDHSKEDLKALTPEMAAAQLVKTTVAANRVVIFSKTYCPYCAKAKAAVSKFLSADKFFVVELDTRNDGDSIQDALLEVTGGRSVPRVFVGGKFIGGGDDTARLAETGELKQLLADAGAL